MSTSSAKDAFDKEVIPYLLVYTDGSIALNTFQKDGEFHGPYVSNDKNGVQDAIGVYYEGKRVGVWTLPQTHQFVLYNKNGDEQISSTSFNDLAAYSEVIEETEPFIKQAIYEVEAATKKTDEKEAAYQAYCRGQPHPTFQ